MKSCVCTYMSCAGPNITVSHWTFVDHFCYMSMSGHAFVLSDKMSTQKRADTYIVATYTCTVPHINKLIPSSTNDLRATSAKLALERYLHRGTYLLQLSFNKRSAA